MSIKVFGILELNNMDLSTKEQEVKKQADISFLIAEKAIKNKIGINLGENIFSGFLRTYERSTKRIPFELTDDPMDINAECLFTGEYVIEVGDDLGEHLESRMLRVQNFLDEVLKTKSINKIRLDLNALDMREDCLEVLEINVANFCSKSLDLYKKNSNWTPVIRIIIKE